MPSSAELKQLIHKGCIALKLVPVFCGSAFKNKGVQPLLDGVVRSRPCALVSALCDELHSGQQ